MKLHEKFRLILEFLAGNQILESKTVKEAMQELKELEDAREVKGAEDMTTWYLISDATPNKVDDQEPYVLVAQLVDTDWVFWVGYFNSLTGRWESIDGTEIYPTHWMPLPKPPQVNGQVEA
jgi:hypothetical protein